MAQLPRWAWPLRISRPRGSRFGRIQVRIFLAFGAAFALAIAGGGWAAARHFALVARNQVESQQANLASLVASGVEDRIRNLAGRLEDLAQDLAPDLSPGGGAGHRWKRASRFEMLLLARPDGRLLAGDASLLGTSPALAPLCRNVETSGRTAVSAAFHAGTEDDPVVLLGTPIRGPKGQLRAILVGGLVLGHDELIRDLVHTQTPEASQLMLVDGEGRVLVHPDPGLPSGPTSPQREPLLTSVHRLDDLPWRLVATVPLAEAGMPVERLRRFLQAAAALAVVLSLVLTWLLSHRLTENLEAFTRDVEEAGDRPAGHRFIPRHGNDETAVLVDAFNTLMTRLDEQAEQLLEAKSRSDEEMALAKHVLHRLVEPGLASCPLHLRMETVRTERINGDACTYREGPNGLHFGFICDATGHGLTAGISTLPAVQTFLSMARRDVPLETIYHEINLRTRQLMPVGRFLCLLLIRLDPRAGLLSILNAGLPDAILAEPDAGLRRFPSRNLPAGINEPRFPPEVDTVEVGPGSRLLAYTDGVLDLFPEGNVDGALLRGLERSPFRVHCKAIQETLTLAIENREQHDDASWALWEVPPPATPCPVPVRPVREAPPVALEEPLSISLTFSPQRHQVRDLLPDLLRMLASRGLEPAAEQALAFSLSEALGHVVDQELLGLGAEEWNQGPETFEALRKLHQGAAHEARATVKLAFRGLPSGRLQEIAVEVGHSGAGFDWRAWRRRVASGTVHPTDEGLMRLEALAGPLVFNEAGTAFQFSIPCG